MIKMTKGRHSKNFKKSPLVILNSSRKYRIAIDHLHGILVVPLGDIIEASLAGKQRHMDIDLDLL